MRRLAARSVTFSRWIGFYQLALGKSVIAMRTR